MPERYSLYPEEPWYSQGLRSFTIEKYIVFYYPAHQSHVIQISRIMYSGQKANIHLPHESAYLQHLFPSIIKYLFKIFKLNIAIRKKDFHFR